MCNPVYGKKCRGCGGIYETVLNMGHYHGLSVHGERYGHGRPCSCPYMHQHRFDFLGGCNPRSYL